MRPVIIDEVDGPCDICAVHTDRCCDECRKKIPIYPYMGGNGYQSVTPTHFHLARIDGVSGRKAFHSELCLECYATHRRAVYPDEQWTPTQ